MSKRGLPHPEIVSIKGEIRLSPTLILFFSPYTPGNVVWSPEALVVFRVGTLCLFIGWEKKKMLLLCLTERMSANYPFIIQV